MRIEESVAILAALTANLNTKGGFTRYQFMDHKEEPAIGLEQAMENWK